MSPNESQLFAVVTGDVIGSTKLTGVDLTVALRTAYSTVVNLLGEEYFPMEIDIFRGDSWQVLINDPLMSADFTLLFRCALKMNKIQFRAAIGIGTIESVPDDRVSNGLGNAYLHSGRAFEHLGNAAGYTLDVSFPEGLTIGKLAPMIRLLDVITTFWSPDQCRVYLGVRQGKTQKEIARDWVPESVTQQAVSKHARDMGTDAVDDMLVIFRENICISYQ